MSLGATLESQPGVAVAQLRAGAGAAGHPRPRRRPRADPAGRAAPRRPLQPVRRPRRRRSTPPRRRASKSCADRRRCSTAPTPSAAWSTSSPTRSRRTRSTGSSGNVTIDLGLGGRGSRGRRRSSTSATARCALHVGGGGRRSGDVAHAARRRAQLTVAQRLRQRRPGVDRHARLPRRQLRLRRHALRHPGRRGRRHRTDAAPARVHRARRGAAISAAPSTASAPRSGIAATSTTSSRASEVGTQFSNNTTELEVMGSHRAVGRLKGSIGGWVLDRAFDAAGEEALSPAVDQRGLAAFVYEEVTWPHVTVQFGGRVDRTALPRRAAKPDARLHQRLGIARPPAAAGGRQRQPDDRGQPGARRAQPGARGAVLLRRAPRQLRARGRATPISTRSTPSASTCRCAGGSRGVGRSDLLPQQHRRLHLPQR